MDKFTTLSYKRRGFGLYATVGFCSVCYINEQAEKRDMAVNKRVYTMLHPRPFIKALPSYGCLGCGWRTLFFLNSTWHINKEE